MHACLGSCYQQIIVHKQKKGQAHGHTYMLLQLLVAFGALVSRNLSAENDFLQHQHIDCHVYTISLATSSINCAQ